MNKVIHIIAQDRSYIVKRLGQTFEVMDENGQYAALRIGGKKWSKWHRVEEDALREASQY